MSRAALLLAALALGGCHLLAAVPLAAWTAAGGVAEGTLRLDDDILHAWMAARGIREAPAAPQENSP